MIDFRGGSYKFFVKSNAGNHGLWRIFALMKKWLFLLLMMGSAYSQTISLRNEVRIDADQLAGEDPFGWYYLIRNNVLVKTDGVSSVEFQDVRLGNLTRVDLRNPLLIVLFYESFNTIVLLDNQMNEVTRIDFNNRPAPMVIKLAGFASRNMLWLYDSLQQQMFLFDYQTDKLQPIGTPFRTTPVQYDTDFNYIVWIDAMRQAYRMDIFGKVTSLGEIPATGQVQYLGEARWLIADGGRVNYYDSLEKHLKLVVDVGNSLKNFYYNDQILSIFTGRVMQHYNFKLP